MTEINPIERSNRKRSSIELTESTMTLGSK